jgi:hypothetical protein
MLVDVGIEATRRTLNSFVTVSLTGGCQTDWRSRGGYIEGAAEIPSTTNTGA